MPRESAFQYAMAFDPFPPQAVNGSRRMTQRISATRFRFKDVPPQRSVCRPCDIIRITSSSNDIPAAFADAGNALVAVSAGNVLTSSTAGPFLLSTMKSIRAHPRQFNSL